MNETQLLTLMLVIKKIKKEVKKQGNSFLLIADDIKELDKRIKQIPLEETKKELKNNIKALEDSIKTILSSHTQELDNKMTDYTTQRENALNDLKMSLKDIEKTLSSFVTKDEFKQFNKQIDDKLKTIPKNVEVEIGEVKTLDPGEEAKVEVVKTDTSYKLNFYIPRGVSGRGMPGKGVPSGGSTNQVLAKNSADDYDTKWVTGGSGGTSDHSDLTNLDYASAGHTGFQPAGDYALSSDIPTKTSELTNDSGFITTPYTLPVATTTVLGGVKPDGSTITADANGVISAITGGTGDVTGPASAGADNIAVFNSTTGKIIKDGGVTIANLPNDKVKYDAGDTGAGYVADKIVAGTGISVAEGTGGNENKLVVTNSAPDQTVAITAGTNITSVTGTYPNFTINADTQAGTYTDEKAQDAVGGMVDSTLVYTDGTPELKVANPVIPATVGFTITAGTTPKTLTVADTASVTGTNTGDQTLATIPLSVIGTPAIDQLNEFENYIQSGGRISGGVITAHAPADGTVDISELQGLVHTTDANGGQLVSFTMSAQSGLALTDNKLNYIYLDYNAGTPVCKATIDRTTIHNYDHFTVGRVYRTGNAVDIVNSGTNIYNGYRRIHNRLVKKYGFDWVSGSTLSESDTRKLAVTDGVWYIGNTEIDTTGFDTNVSGTFSTYYLTGSTWTKTDGVAQLGNTQYNDVASGLVSLGVAKYANYWVYICPEGDLYVLYGQAQYNSLAEAQATLAPSQVPDYINAFCRLIARISFKQAGTNFASVSNTLVRPIMMTSVSNHNNLGGLQGGTVDEYNHLTTAQHTIATQSATATRDGYLTSTDWSTFNGKQPAGSYEVTTNKENTTIDTSTTKYPTVNLLKTGLDGKVDKSTYDANSILYATNDNTPLALTVGEQTFVGRKTGGNISALTAAEARTILNVADGATANVGDMVLNASQSVTELKTFTKDKLAMKGTSTGVNTISVANTSATSYTNTLPAKNGTFAMTDDIVSQVEDSIVDGHTTTAPSGNAVYDALALKAPLTAPTFATSITGSYLTASEMLITDGSKNIVSAPVATYPSLTELTNLKGTGSPIQAQIDAKTSITGWIPETNLPYYGSVDDPTGVIKMDADRTSVYSPGMRIKFTNGGHLIYGIVTAVAYSAPSTSVTFLHEIDPSTGTALYPIENSQITGMYYSSMKAPFGFPLQPDKWAVFNKTINGFSQSSPTQNQWYNAKSLVVPIGAWNIEYISVAYASSVASKTAIRLATTLSTANNSESDVYTSCAGGFNGASGTLTAVNNVYNKTYITPSAKTTYYFNIRTTTASADVAAIGLSTAQGTTLMATCAYL